MEMTKMSAGEDSEIPCTGGSSVTPTLSWLPDSVLLEVLSFLSVRDLILSCREPCATKEFFVGLLSERWAHYNILGKLCVTKEYIEGELPENCGNINKPVCKRWMRLILDKSLWRHVDLTPYMLTSKIFWYLVRHRLGTSLQTLKIKGLLYSTKKQEFLTPAVLQVLEKRYPSLENLYLQETSLRSLTYDCLPSTLKMLHLSKCEVPMSWFRVSPNKDKVLPKLEILILNTVSSFSNQHLEAICSHSALKTLYLSGTYRVTDIGIQKAITYLKGLEHLKLHGCNLTDITLHLIGCHLKHLRTLFLTNFCALTDAGLSCLSGVKTLEKLWLEYCYQLSSSSIITVCVNLPALNFLNLNGIIFEGHGIDEIRKRLPHCTVTNTIPDMDAMPKL